MAREAGQCVRACAAMSMHEVTKRAAPDTRCNKMCRRSSDVADATAAIRQRGPCYTFAHVHTAQANQGVARPGSMALAGPVHTRLSRRNCVGTSFRPERLGLFAVGR